MAVALPPHVQPAAASVADGRGSRPVTHRLRVGRWTVETTTDPFVGSVGCRILARGVSYEHGVLTFAFGPRTDTYEAMYKVDDKPAVSWRTAAMALAARGAFPRSNDLRRPSGGRVALLVSAVAGARTVTIRPSPAASPRVFDLEGLDAARQAASRSACPDTAATADAQ